MSGPQPHDNGWHVDRKISVTNVISTIVILVGLFQWGGKVETRLSLLEQQQANIQQQFADKLDDIKETLTDLKTEIRSLRDSQSSNGDGN